MAQRQQKLAELRALIIETDFIGMMRDELYREWCQGDRTEWLHLSAQLSVIDKFEKIFGRIGVDDGDITD